PSVDPGEGAWGFRALSPPLGAPPRLGDESPFDHATLAVVDSENRAPEAELRAPSSTPLTLPPSDSSNADLDRMATMSGAAAIPKAESTTPEAPRSLIWPWPRQRPVKLAPPKPCELKLVAAPEAPMLSPPTPVFARETEGTIPSDDEVEKVPDSGLTDLRR